MSDDIHGKTYIQELREANGDFKEPVFDQVINEPRGRRERAITPPAMVINNAAIEELHRLVDYMIIFGGLITVCAFAYTMRSMR